MKTEITTDYNNISIGWEYIFDYPEGFSTLPDYSAHRGSVVKVVRKMSEDEADTGIPESAEDYIPMFEIVAEDGWRGKAWGDELKPKSGGAR